MKFRIWAYNQWCRNPRMIMEFLKLELYIWRMPTWEFNAGLTLAGLGIGISIRRSDARAEEAGT